MRFSLYTLVIINLLAATPSYASMTRYDRWKSHVPFQAAWGPYVLRVEQVGHKDDRATQRFQILNHRGRVLREIRDYAITCLSTIELTGRAPAELRVECWSGGVNFAFTDVFFTRERGLRTMLIFRGYTLGVREIRDLDHNGRPEIITDNPALKDFSGYNFYRPSPLVTILRWQGSRYVDVTRYYPRFSFAEARRMRDSITEYLLEPPKNRYEWALEDEVTGYYANMLAIGRGREARLWLKAHIPAHTFRWLKQHEPELRHLVRNVTSRVAQTSQDRVIDLTE